jgi:hypothetical protein
MVSPHLGLRAVLERPTAELRGAREGENSNRHTRAR